MITRRLWSSSACFWEYLKDRPPVKDHQTSHLHHHYYFQVESSITTEMGRYCNSNMSSMIDIATNAPAAGQTISLERGLATPLRLSHHSEPEVSLFTLATDSATIATFLLVLLFLLGYVCSRDLKSLELEMQTLLPFCKPHSEHPLCKLQKIGNPVVLCWVASGRDEAGYPVTNPWCLDCH